MKNKNLIVLCLLYLLFISVLFLTSNALTRYYTSSEVSGNFDIGKKLYFNYERGDLFRNNQLIVGVEVENPKYDQNGNLIEVERRIETMNVVPGDVLVFHFYVSNFNSITEEANGIDGVFHAFGTSQLSMPVKGRTYDLNCSIKYRMVDEDGKEIAGDAGAYKTFTQDKDESLPIFDKTNKEDTYIKYEFQISVTLDDQIESTNKDDYFGATLSIYLSVVAANVI